MPLPFRRPLPSAVIALLVVALAAPALAQRHPEFTGKVGVYVPEPTADGDWNGTWMYNSIEAKIALWMRTRRGKTEVRVKYEGGRGALGFETDWTGASSYFSNEQPSSFAMRFTKRSPSELEGTWNWITRLRSASRTENGTFTLFRAQDGRTLVMKFDQYELATIRQGKTTRTTTPPVWSFQKASKREALWDELPF